MPIVRLMNQHGARQSFHFTQWSQCFHQIFIKYAGNWALFLHYHRKGKWESDVTFCAPPLDNIFLGWLHMAFHFLAWMSQALIARSLAMLTRINLQWRDWSSFHALTLLRSSLAFIHRWSIKHTHHKVSSNTCLGGLHIMAKGLIIYNDRVAYMTIFWNMSPKQTFWGSHIPKLAGWLNIDMMHTPLYTQVALFNVCLLYMTK